MISAVIPVYNEAGCLPHAFEAMASVLQRVAGDDWEIILVDDGSADATAAGIEALCTAHPQHVRGASHPQNLGKGAAVRTGVLASRGDLVLFCDADMSTPPETLESFVQAMEDGADVVVGNRKSREAVIERWQPPIRTWLGLGFTRLANGMMGLSISDYTCGFKLFRGDAGRAIFEATEAARWSFDVEILARAAQMGLELREIPVRWHDQADTRVKVLRDVVNSFLELWAIRRRLGRTPPHRS